jgi:hypothetical protein
LERTGVAVPIFVVCLIIVGAVGAFAGYKMAPAAAPAELADGSVTTSKLADGAVTLAKLAAEALARMPVLPLASENLANGAVTTSKLADNSVTLAKLASEVVSRLGAPGYGLVTTDNIADGAVTTSKLADGAVTLAKLAAAVLGRMPTLPIATENIADGAVTSAKIADGTIGTADISDDAITSAKIADNAVTWGMIAGKPIEVVAAGIIRRDGTIVENFNIKSVRWDATNSCYRISLIGVDYVFPWTHVTAATAIGYNPMMVTTDGLGNDLVVYLYDTAGNKVQGTFHFVVYKIT